MKERMDVLPEPDLPISRTFFLAMVLAVEARAAWEGREGCGGREGERRARPVSVAGYVGEGEVSQTEWDRGQNPIAADGTEL
jgi:hypothetical protein